jgi:hypothetical protein
MKELEDEDPRELLRHKIEVLTLKLQHACASSQLDYGHQLQALMNAYVKIDKSHTHAPEIEN